jgi:hypothetical protein
MGIIDKKTFILICSCGAEETASILDTGSNWGGSFWQSRKSFSKFNTTWSGGGQEEPEIISATCKVCGKSPEIKSKY